MEVYINNQKIDIKLENEKTVGEVLTALQIEAEKNSATITKISVDDKIISANEFDQEAKKELNENTKISVQMISTFDIDDSLKNVSELLFKSGKNLVEIPVLLQTNKNKDADLFIKNFADCFDSFCQIVSFTALFPEKYSKFLIGENNINEFFKDFSPIVNELYKAYESKDFVTVGDLCEYEISPRLLQISNSVKEFLENTKWFLYALITLTNRRIFLNVENCDDEILNLQLAQKI